MDRQTKIDDAHVKLEVAESARNRANLEYMRLTNAVSTDDAIRQAMERRMKCDVRVRDLAKALSDLMNSPLE